MEGSSFYRTEYIARLNDTLSSPTKEGAILLGSAGSGKSTLLSLFSREAIEHNNIVITVQVRDVLSPEDVTQKIVQEVLRAPDEVWSPSINRAEFQTLRELGSRLQQMAAQDSFSLLSSFFNRMDSLLRKDASVVVALDGLDEAKDPERISLLIEELSRKHLPRLKIIVASRETAILDRLSRYRNFDVIRISALSQEEATAYIKSLAPNVHLDSNVVQDLMRISQGNPLILRLLAAELSSGIQPHQLILTLGDSLNLLWSRVIERVTSEGMNKNHVERITLIIAIFGPISMQSLAELSGLPIEEIAEYIQKLISWGFLFISTATGKEQELTVFHQSFRDYFLKIIARADEISISELQFGAEAAEQDKYLKESFIYRPGIKEILNGHKTIIIGDRGSGKSAIFEFIKNHEKSQASQSAGSNDIGEIPELITVTADDPSSFITSIVDSNSADHSAERFKAAWLLYVSALISKNINRPILNNSDPKYRKDVEKLLENVGWSSEISKQKKWAKITWKFLKNIIGTGLKFNLGPITIEPKIDKDKTSNTSKKSFDIGDFLSTSDKTISQNKKRILILIDKIDEIFKYQRTLQEELVQGLMMAEAHISEKESIRLAVLLRSDLYETYDIQEQNKCVSRSLRLEWSQMDLLELMIRRLFANKPLIRLANLLQVKGTEHLAQSNTALRIAFPEEVEALPFRHWLFSNLANGKGHISPRQIILFMILARDLSTDNTMKEGSHFPLFKPKVVRDAMTRLSELSYKEVVDDFRVARTFVRNCRTGNLKEFKLQSVEGLFDRAEGPISGQVELLERLGFLERIVSQNGQSIEYRFKIPSLFTRCWNEMAS